MKFLALSALAATASATNLVTHPNGAVTPVETYEVQAAKAAHFAAKGALPYTAGYLGYAGAYAAPYGYNTLPYTAGYNGGLVAHANGAVVPQDTPSVAAAKAEHFAAKGLTAPLAYAGAAYAPYAAAAYAPYANGAYAHGAYAHGAYAAPFGYAAYNGGLVAHANGAVVPQDTPSVAAAKAEHFAAKGVIAPAVAYNGLYNGAAYAPYAGAYAGAYAPYAGAYAGAYAPYAGAYAGAYAPYAYQPSLTVHQNGAVVPVEPKEVIEARAEHLSHF
jgi:hypothetical protein